MESAQQVSTLRGCIKQHTHRLMLLSMMITSVVCAQGAPSPAAAPGVGAGPGPGQAATPEVDHSKECDSQCLRNHVDKYLEAYSKHDPSTLIVNPTLRASENSRAVALGDNSWNQVRRILPERVVLTDPFAGQVMALGVIEMRGPQSFVFSVRLKIENNKISESEIQTISDSTGGVHFRPDLMMATYKTLDATVPATERVSREELLKLARVAWGLDSGTVSRTATCLHYENWESPDGGSACRGAGRNPRNVRVPLIDVEKGVAISYVMEDFSSPQTGNGPPSEANIRLPVFYLQPTTISIAKAAKFINGKFAMDAWLMQTGDIGMMPVFRK